MIVCVCNRLNETRIRAACASLPPQAEDVYALCGVERNCGRCQDTIEDLLDEAKDLAGGMTRAA